MGSIRTITFGDSKFKWNTAISWQVHFYHDSIRSCYYKYIKNEFLVNNHSDIRSKALNIMQETIKDENKIQSMQDLVNLIAAMRFTQINENEFDENGNFKVSFMIPPRKFERITFYNIIFHINHHCRQTYKFCFVQVVPRYKNEENGIAYTAGEYKDKLHYDGVDLYMLSEENYQRRNNSRRN